MVRLKTSVPSLITEAVVAAHFILLPALYFGLGYVIRASHEDLFIQHSRTFARLLAEEFEVSSALDSGTRTTDLLDLAVTHGGAAFAELDDRGRVTRSSLGDPDVRVARRSDLGFSRTDDTYFIVLPVARPDHAVELRLGFDERPTKERIALAMNRMLVLLTAYLCVAVAMTMFLSQRLSRPIRRLQAVSRSIASGNYAEELSIGTRIREIFELGGDLEAMRRELVGVNERLRAQMHEKELSEARRDELQRQLRHGQRLETVGTLAGGIAHEFNNVLVPILLFTEAALQDQAPGSAARADLERVMDSARRAREIVQKILTFSRVLGDARLGPIDMRRAVNEAILLFAALASPHVRIERDIDADIPPVRGDTSLAIQLVMNLCANAYQALHAGAGTITLELRRAPGGVELSVGDTGHGMDAATLERIFEPFFTTREVGQGTGLGLSVVHGIVESFGATISVQSTVGVGTKFTIVFPELAPELAGETAAILNS